MKKWFNLVKINRFFAWVLLFAMFAYFISGYGMTKEIIDSSLATKIHLDILPIVILAAFCIHAPLSVRISFIRWKIWNIFTRILIAIIFIGTFITFVYTDQYYSKSNNTNTKSETKQSEEPSNEEKTEVFSASELARYNGENGEKAYVAVDGVVYDVTSVFEEGSHFSHIAGQELTEEFYSKHVLEEITKYPVVGEYK